MYTKKRKKSVKKFESIIQRPWTDETAVPPQFFPPLPGEPTIDSSLNEIKKAVKSLPLEKKIEVPTMLEKEAKSKTFLKAFGEAAKECHITIEEITREEAYRRIYHDEKYLRLQAISTAEQFAEEINSGNISIKDCYTCVWSYSIVLFNSEIVTVNKLWSKTINSISLMLEESKFYELLEVITKNYFLWKPKLSLSKHGEIFEDLLIAGDLIGNRKNVDYSSPIVDSIISELYSDGTVFHEDDDRNNQKIDFSSKRSASLKKMNSLRVAFDACDFVLRGDFDNYLNDFPYSAKGEAAKIIIQISEQSEQNRRAIENELLSRFNHEVRHVGGRLIYLMGAVGTEKSFKALCQIMHTSWFGAAITYHISTIYWISFFNIIERHDFDPQLIGLFNQHMSGKFWDKYTMEAYHQHITEYARSFQERGKRESLYSYLEKKGMQFWDYWMTYMPGCVKTPVFGCLEVSIPGIFS